MALWHALVVVGCTLTGMALTFWLGYGHGWATAKEE